MQYGILIPIFFRGIQFMQSLLLSAENISKARLLNKKRKDVLNGASMHIKRGEIVGLLGVNGAGKTTLASIIASLNPPTSGDIIFKGISIYQDLARYRLKLGYCPQQPNFENNLSVRENLLFAGRYFGLTKNAVNERAQELMQLFELTQYADASPSELSGGYQRRLLVARALMHNPELLILDEPTVGMDPAIRKSFVETIGALKQTGLSVLLTTHYLDEIEQLADRVYILDGGAILDGGTIRELNEKYKTKNLEELFFVTTAKKMDCV